jgi:hypothetical protein
LLIGCGIEPALSGKARGDYLKSIKPYLQYWEKEGVTVEGRREDSWACGAARTVHGASHVIFSDEQEKAERRPGENNDFAARERLSRAWVECMKAKGYHYEDGKGGREGQKVSGRR